MFLIVENCAPLRGPIAGPGAIFVAQSDDFMSRPPPSGSVTLHVGRTLARLAIPTFAAIVGDQVLGIADTVVIGTLGADSLAAITGAATVFFVIVLSIQGFNQGAGILAAQAAGARDFERFGQIARASLVVPIGLGIVLAAAGLWLAQPALRALVGPLPTLHAGAVYLTLRCFSIVPATLSGLAATMFGAAGDTGFGFKLLVWINVIHIPVLLVLALGWGTHHPMGIVGAGVASLCAEIVGAAYAIVAVRRRPQYRIFAGRDVEPRLIARLFGLGLPEALYLFFVIAPDIAVVAILAPLGAPVIAAFRVISIVSDVTWAVPGSLGNAAQIVIGQRFGANDLQTARTFAGSALQYGVALSTVVGIITAAAAWPIAFGCTLNPGVASLAAGPLALHMLTLPLKGYAMLGLARVRAIGDTRFSLFAGLIAGAVDVPATWAAVHVLHTGLFAVPLAWIAAWLFWCVATALRLRRFQWPATAVFR